MNRLELPVGGVFTYTDGGENPLVLHNARVVDVTNDPLACGMPCDGCIFEGGSIETCYHIACTQLERSDAKNVKFVEVKFSEVKGGEE